MSTDPKILIPLIRTALPELLARDILSVQPMQDSVGDVFRMKFDPSLPSSPEEPPPAPKEGDKRHAFSRGWEIYYGNEWVPMEVWWKIKGAGL